MAPHIPPTSWGQSRSAEVSFAEGVNSGRVVGYYPNDPYVDHAFVWLPDTPNGVQGSVIDINQLLNMPDQSHWTLTRATGINDLGQIVGNALFDADGPGGNPAVPRAFLLTPVPEPTTAFLTGGLMMGVLVYRGDVEVRTLELS